MDLEEAFRNVAADSMAQGFLLERMFRDYLLAMPKRERAEFAGGKFSLTSSAGQGTCISVEI